jgi:hypothetical protein
VTAAAPPNVPMGVVEILDRSGRVQQRMPFDGGTISIGRAHDNDIVVDDPYVCPHHLELTVQDGEVTLRDPGSVNGSYLAGQRGRFTEARLHGSGLVHFGHSQLRVRPPGTPVAPTLRDISRHGVLAWFDRPVTWVLGPLAGLAALTADTLQDLARNPGLGELASEMIYPVLGIFLWAACWALVNRVVSHRSNLPVHLAIAGTGVAALFLAGEAVSLAGFAFGMDRLVAGARLAVQVLVAAGAVYIHLRYATHGKGRLQGAVAVISALLLFGIPAVDDYLDRIEFDTVPYLDPLLKPPVFRLRAGVSPERFFQDSDALKAGLDEQDTR